MTNVAGAFEWQFGGALRDAPLPVAWSILGALAAMGIFFVVWQYRHTLRELSSKARRWLAALRAMIVIAVLFCLANPSRVERRAQEKNSGRDTLAVLVDRSDSMSAPDHRGTTRLASAARLWKQHENEARAAFQKISYFRFAAGFDSAANFDDALSEKNTGSQSSETHLFSALRKTLDTNPAAIVCLTDGLDTTSEKADELVSDAQRRGVPIYFAAGENRARAGEILNIREVKAPTRVLRQTQFSASALIEVATAQPRELPVELWSGSKKIASARLPLQAGLNTLPWSAIISASEVGAMPLEFRVGDGETQQVAACTTQVVEQTKVEILYYQGALQWGFRFLRAALENDPSFHMTSILNPALRVQITTSESNQPTLVDFPDDARELKRFQIIVLAHVFADRLTTKQQNALLEFARSGGGVLFIAPDSDATQRFVGTPIEQMLPVVFEGANEESRADAASQNFHNQMLGTMSRDDEAALFGDETNNSRQQNLPRLRPFALPDNAGGASRSAIAAIFENADPANLPKFCNFAKVRAIKPGADVLAINPLEKNRGASGVLLARQQFGSGFTAALTTDLLWRWKMSLPSTSRAAEKFWQQLLLSLAPAQGHSLRLVKETQSAAVKNPVTLRVEGSTNQSVPTAEIISPTGERTRLVLQNVPGDENAAVWNATFTPSSAGRWEARASDAEKNFARLTFSVTEILRTTETLNLPPAIDAMRKIAESSGGSLIQNEPVFQSRAELEKSDDARAKIERVHPIWDSSWLLCAMLGLYCTELIARRCFRLL